MSDAPHIYTLTGNLLAERTLEFTTWSPGRTQRAVHESFQVGGKGINVSKMLTRLGAPNTALCFTGGASGVECEAWLRQRQFTYHAFLTDRPTRVGTVVRSDAPPETTFLGPDVIPSFDAVKAAAGYLDSLPAGQLLALCGSFPGWTDPRFNPLRSALERWMTRGILTADTYGAPLLWLAERSLALIKINAAEFRAYAGTAPALDAALLVARETSPVASWVITEGPGRVWFASTATAPASLEPPLVREVSATGSGDVMFASLLDSVFRRRTTLREAVAAALPLAAANAAHPAIAEFP